MPELFVSIIFEKLWNPTLSFESSCILSVCKVTEVNLIEEKKLKLYFSSSIIDNKDYEQSTKY